MKEFNENTLPSKTIPYAVKSIKMEPFKIRQIMLLSRAVSLNSLRPAIDALNDVIDYDANLLTDGDFYFLLAQQRIVNYKSPLQAAWKCEGIVFVENDGLRRTFTQEEIVELVEEYETCPDNEKHLLTDPDKLLVTSQKCGHQNTLDITEEHLDIVYLDEVDLPEGLDFPRVFTLPDAIARKDSPEYQNIINAARWVAEGNTLEEKLQVLEKQDDLRLFEAALRADATYSHGVSAIVTLPCEKCGTLARHSFDIGPNTFFDV